MTHIEITDVTGAQWVGDSADEMVTVDEWEQLRELLSNFRELNHVSLEIAGAKHYFNPAHIVSVAVHAEG